MKTNGKLRKAGRIASEEEIKNVNKFKKHTNAFVPKAIKSIYGLKKFVLFKKQKIRKQKAKILLGLY